MKILILNWRDIRHPLSGGAEVSLHEHAKYWRQKKNDIIWFSSSFEGGKAQESIDGIRVIRRGTHFTVHLWAFFYYITKKFENVDIIIDSFHFLPFFTPLYMRSKKVIGLINEVAGKIWFANLWYPFALIGYYLEPFFFYFYRQSVFITGSQSTKDELTKIGLPQKNIQVVHHGFSTVHISSQVKKEKDPTIIFLGRVSTDKGIQDLLDAFVKVKQKIKNMQLWIVGKEEKQKMMQALLQTIPSKKIKDSIHYFGFVSERKKHELLKKAWILVHPSKKEGWGLNVIEAASQGTPTIGYNVEGLRDSVNNGKTGILVDPENASLLSETIESIIGVKSKYKYNQLSKNALLWSKKFSWDKSVKQGLKILKQVYDINKKK